MVSKKAKNRLDDSSENENSNDEAEKEAERKKAEE